MKLAILADCHGNHYGLAGVLADLERERPDVIIVAGDMLGPFPGTRQVFEEITKARYRNLVGNADESYIARHSELQRGSAQDSIAEQPRNATVSRLRTEDMAVIKTWPRIIYQGKRHPQEILVCHGTPFQTTRSISEPFTPEEARALQRLPASVIVGAHYHILWEKVWHEKLLVHAGSCGLPNTRQMAMNYLVLEYRHGEWERRYKTVSYDHDKAINEYAQSGYLVEAGPVGWIYFASLYYCTHFMGPFRATQYVKYQPETYPEWVHAIIEFFQEQGIYATLKKYLP